MSTAFFPPVFVSILSVWRIKSGLEFLLRVASAFGERTLL
jgi:hypothetical protein